VLVRRRFSCPESSLPETVPPPPHPFCSNVRIVERCTVSWCVWVRSTTATLTSRCGMRPLFQCRLSLLFRVIFCVSPVSTISGSATSLIFKHKISFGLSPPMFFTAQASYTIMLHLETQGFSFSWFSFSAPYQIRDIPVASSIYLPFLF